MEAVFLLRHVHEAEEGSEDSKLIGVYRTDEAARAAIERLRNQPGFRSFPKGFNTTHSNEWIEPSRTPGYCDERFPNASKQ
jgi:hypothetical protein